MSFMSEKVMKKANEFLADHLTENMSEEEIQELLNQFMYEHNQNLPGRLTEKTAKTASDFLELAEGAMNEKTAMRYAKKALALEPDNLDARRMLVSLSPMNEVERLQRIETLVQEGKALMEKQGFADEESIGHYWDILETRPYMRLLEDYVYILIESGMFGRAAAQCEKMLRLCESDNLGIRYTLMHLYAFFENEVAALGLHRRYGGYEETQMLMAMSVLYYKLGQWDKAGEYLSRVAKINKDVKKFFKSIFDETFEQFAGMMGRDAYTPDTGEELCVEMMQNEFLFHSTPGFMIWADKHFRGKRTKKKV